MTHLFDCGIIGAGVAGAFATYRIAKYHNNVSTILFDLGKKPQKRRRQLEGWLGCLPNSDGKLYLSDLSLAKKMVGPRKAKAAQDWFMNVISNINTFKIVKDKYPTTSMTKNIRKQGYNISLNDYMQTYPKDIHALSKYIAEDLEQNKNISYSFDNEILDIRKQRNVFIITSEEGEFRCKKLILSVGRSGWRWATELYNNFGIVDENDTARFGIRIEMNSNILKEFNKSTCTLDKDDNLKIGPFSWSGSIIPEDHIDMAISAFRSNENRWKTDKVSFNFIGSRIYPNKGFEQTDRIGKLTFVLANDRIIREKVSAVLNDRSKISIIPEYHWLKEAVLDFSEVIPEITSKAYFHIPTIIPQVPKINIGTNLETEVNGLYVAGESTGTSGILFAAITGIVAADMVCK